MSEITQNLNVLLFLIPGNTMREQKSFQGYMPFVQGGATPTNKQSYNREFGI